MNEKYAEQGTTIFQFSPTVAAAKALRLTNFFLWSAAFLLAVMHLYFLLKYKIDLPISDEWSDFNPWRGFSTDLSSRWLFATTNSHPMVGQRLISWFFLVADGRNLRTQAIVQFMALVPVAFIFLRVLEKRLNVYLGWVALLFFTSLHVSNLFWPFMNFLYIHFFMMTAGLFFVTTENPRLMILGYLLSAFAALQAGSGLATAAATMVVAGLLWWRLRTHLYVHAFGSLIIAVTLILWLIFVPRDNVFVLENAPWSLHYWGFIGAATSSAIGMGYPRINPEYINTTATAGMLLVLLGVCLAIWHAFVSGGQVIGRSHLARFSVALFIVSLGSVAIIAFGRPWETGFGVHRYHIISLPIILSIVLMLLSVVDIKLSRQLVRDVSRVVIFIGIFAWTVPNLNIAEQYEKYGKEVKLQRSCAREFFANPGSESCREGPYSWGVEQGHIKRAESLGSSFCFTVVENPALYTDVADCYNSLNVK